MNVTALASNATRKGGTEDAQARRDSSSGRLDGRRGCPGGLCGREHWHQRGSRAGLLRGVQPARRSPAPSASYVREVVVERPVYVAPAPGVVVQRAPAYPNVVQYPNGRYELHGDGIYTADQW